MNRRCDYGTTDKKLTSTVELLLITAAVALVTVACVAFASEQSDAATSWDSKDCTVTIDDGTLTVTRNSGDGAMADYGSSSDAPWYGYEASVLKIVISDDVTYIGSNAFSDCKNVRSVTVPESVTKVNDTAFDGFSFKTIPGGKLTVDKIVGHTLTGFGDRILYVSSGKTGDCTWTYDITSNTVVISGDGDMGDYSLMQKAPWGEKVYKAVIKNGVTSIGVSAFEGCDTLSEITLPESVIKIGDSAFQDCHALCNVMVQGDVRTIGGCAFTGCHSIKEIDLPNSVTSIGVDAFAYCTAMEGFIVPSSLTSLSEEMFYNCTSLKTLEIKALRD